VGEREREGLKRGPWKRSSKREVEVLLVFFITGRGICTWLLV
jgi:hypothetical protein